MTDRVEDGGRRGVVLEAALEVFCRLGYQKTSMADVAAQAQVSRQGLYFMFDSKQGLFAAATSYGVERDLARAAAAVVGRAPLSERLLAAFEAWSGRYVGGAGTELSAVVLGHPDLVDAGVRDAPQRFRDVVAQAIAAGRGRWDAVRVDAVTATLVSTSVGVKHQVWSCEDYRRAMSTAIELLVG